MQVLAFDLGASNGRAIVGEYNRGKIVLHEVHRFANNPVKMNKYLYWDFPRLLFELKTALIKAENQGYKIQSVGIDSWGVDYGVLDDEGELMANPIHYRDERCSQGMERLLERYDEKALKERTGMDCVSYNTINQFMMDKYIRWDQANAVLNTPDLFNYFLTGKKQSEYSMATTTQLLDYETMDWNQPLIQELGFNPDLFMPITPSGTNLGLVKEEIAKELGIQPFDVISVTSHDTALALQGLPMEEDYLFIATGTWIIVGAKQEKMTMNEKVMEYGLTNEGGRYPSVNLLKNHVGLWILQESKRYWENNGVNIGFGEMVEVAREASINSIINIYDPRFFEPGDMPTKVQDYCRETKQQVPNTIGEIVRVIEESLAKQIAKTLSELEEAVDKRYNYVCMFGGGVQDQLLCQLIEKYSKKKLVFASKEATALGNIVEQFIALGTMKEEERIKVLEASM